MERIYDMIVIGGVTGRTAADDDHVIDALHLHRLLTPEIRR